MNDYIKDYAHQGAEYVLDQLAYEPDNLEQVIIATASLLYAALRDLTDAVEDIAG